MLSAFKNFFITFLVAALIFGAIAYFATQFLTETISGIFDSESNELDSILNPTPDNTKTPDETDPPVTEGPTVTDPALEISGESFNMLFVVTDYQPDMFGDYRPDSEMLSQMQNDSPSDHFGVLGADFRPTRAVSIVLMRADKERREFTYTVFPAATRVTTSSGDHLLGDLYELYGLDYIISTVSGMSGLTVDYYLQVNVTELYNIVNAMGGFPLYLTKDLYYNGLMATAVKPSAELVHTMPLLYGIGKNTIDGSGSIALMMWDDRTSATTHAERNTLLVNVLSAIIKKLTDLPEAEFTALYDKACTEEWVKTTFTPKELVARIELIYAIKNDAFTEKTIDYPGRFVAATDTADAYFAPSTGSAITIFKNYRKVVDENP